MRPEQHVPGDTGHSSADKGKGQRRSLLAVKGVKLLATKARARSGKGDVPFAWTSCSAAVPGPIWWSRAIAIAS
jgi:hypothetical protein